MGSWGEALRGTFRSESWSGGRKEAGRPLSWAWHPRGQAWASLTVQLVKNQPAVQETWV